MKKPLSLLLSFIVVLSGAATAMATHSEGHVFDDLEPDDPYFEYIQQLYGLNIVRGKADGTLGGDDPLNRAELVTVTARAKKIDILFSDKNCFPDVQEQWFAGAVCAMVRLGYISGYPDGFFRPERPVTAGEAAKIKANAIADQTFVDLGKALNYLDSRGLILVQLGRDDIINRKESFARLYTLMRGPIEPVFMEQVDSEGNPFNPETDTIMVIEPEGPVFFVDYNEEQFNRHFGKDPIILFFHAGWCYRCRTSEKLIWEEQENLVGGAVIFKVDFDTEHELRKTYGITIQDTFVAINSDGKVVREEFSVRSLEEIQGVIDDAVNG